MALRPNSGKGQEKMCDFQHGTIECRGDGYCWDADSDGFDPGDHSMPCPACNTKGWLEQRKEEAETCSSFCGFDSGTGVDIWESAVKVARRENPEGLEVLLHEIGVVNALYEDGKGEIQTKQFVYSAQVAAKAPATLAVDCDPQASASRFFEVRS